MLSVKSLTKKYMSQHSHVIALEDVSFDIAEGEFISIVGPSGCGKSTLLRIMAGLEYQTEGEVVFVRGEQSMRIGFVPQNYSLFPWLSVYENVAFGLRIQNKTEEEIQTVIHKYLRITGLDRFKDSYPKQLSGGMRQRVAIVRALATNPDIILMDEPFGALDVQTRSQMQEFLLTIMRQENKAVVMVTHDIEEAVYVSDRVLVLTARPGTLKEIVSTPFGTFRKPELKNQKEFIEMKKSISYLLKSESIRSTTDEKNRQNEQADIIIGANIWTGIIPLYLAEERGIFVAHGLRHSVLTFERSSDRLEPLRSSRVDALYTPLDSALIEIQKDPDLEIFMPLDFSWGGDAIIANSDIQTIQELRGKTIGVEEDWVSGFFLEYILKKEGISIDDVHLQSMRAADIGKELLRGTIHAASVQEPWLTKIKEYAPVNTLKTTRDFAPLIYAVLLVKKEVLEEKREFFEKFRKSWIEAISILSINSVESIGAVAPYLGLSEMELSEQLENIEFRNIEKSFADAQTEIKKFLGLGE